MAAKAATFHPPPLDRLLESWSRGDESARDELIERVYPELRRLAGKILRDSSGVVTLQATELVHELFFRLAKQNRTAWQGKGQFFAISGRLLRRSIVDHLRHRSRLKRGGPLGDVTLDRISLQVEEDVFETLALDRALDKLARIDGRGAAFVELRFFGGLTHDEAAEALGVGRATASRSWRFARAWLRQELAGDAHG